MRIQKLNSDTKKNLLEDLLKRSPNNYGQYEASVKEILDKVKEEKDAAVFAYTAKFDGAELTADTIEVTDAASRTGKNGFWRSIKTTTTSLG